ncbi:hypothetical protein EAG_03668, partial [Camponotus floridanus]
VFSHKATFELNSQVNRNTTTDIDNNPHWMMESYTQYPQKLNVWVRIPNDTLIGSFFIHGDLTAEKAILRDQIFPTIRQIAGKNFVETWYQQDGAPPHYTCLFR